MQVKLVKDLFENSLCDLSVNETCIVISRPGEIPVSVPLCELRCFSLEGKGDRLRRFVLESNTGNFEGFFTNDSDAEAFVSELREKCRCYVNVLLDMS